MQSRGISWEKGNVMKQKGRGSHASLASTMQYSRGKHRIYRNGVAIKRAGNEHIWLHTDVRRK